MKFFDSSFWVAFFDADDSQHAKARSIFEREQNFCVTEYCVLETATILTQKRGKSQAIAFLTCANDNANVMVVHSTPVFFEATIRLFQALTEKKLSFVDVSLLLLSESHEIVTFDKALTRTIKKLRK